MGDVSAESLIFPPRPRVSCPFKEAIWVSISFCGRVEEGSNGLSQNCKNGAFLPSATGILGTKEGDLCLEMKPCRVCEIYTLPPTRHPRNVLRATSARPPCTVSHPAHASDESVSNSRAHLEGPPNVKRGSLRVSVSLQVLSQIHP